MVLTVVLMGGVLLYRIGTLGGDHIVLTGSPPECANFDYYQGATAQYRRSIRAVAVAHGAPDGVMMALAPELPLLPLQAWHCILAQLSRRQFP